ncbi:MAG TPA: transposase [Longimicrobiales bacterium]
MPRKRRLHLPGAGFHITARTQGGAVYFVPEMRSAIADDIEQAMLSFGHTLLAYVVMHNHFHIVIRQGESPLAWVMQRIMQRTVARVRRAHGGEGHVFGRPYWAAVCTNPGYLRRAIVYTHMNPCKAELCDAVDGYPWSSHKNYIAVPTTTLPRQSCALEGIMLFADASLERADAVRNYQRFIEHCVAQRANQIPGDWLLPEGPQRHLLPSAAQGDTYWLANYSTFSEVSSFTRSNVDVSHAATSLLSRIDPALRLDDIRMAGRSRIMGKVRRRLIEALIIHGCRSIAISRCLRVSPSLVSSVSAQMRFAAMTAS